MDLLRLSTAGSVDDGKSTLIGRLLYDTKSIFEDQWAQVEVASRRSGEANINLALLTDGLRAEREQKITIDVAYRYFATPRRKFIIADTPGHLQYTRNMVTGASTADLAVILVDARKGLLTQSRRHAFITSLLGIPQVVVAVNKMDLVDWSEEVFERIRADFDAFSKKLNLKHIAYVPMSALHGDNVVDGSSCMPWYRGGPLLEQLETATVGARKNAIDFRFPIQTVIRPNQDYRGFAGSVVSGSIAVGASVVALPSKQTSQVISIERFEGPQERADVGDAVVLRLADEIDLSRGEMLVRTKNLPLVGTHLEAYLCWMHDRPLQPHMPYILHHTTRQVTGRIERVEYRVDVDSLHSEPSDTLGVNDIGRVEIRTSAPLFFDPYRVNHGTGSFLLIDPTTYTTVAAGIIRGEVRSIDQVESGQGAITTDAGALVSPDVTWEPWNISREAREARNGHGALVIWFTGPSGAGKSTLARALERTLWEEGRQTMLLDGDQIRHGISGDLGFSPEDRSENIRRVGEVAKLFFEAGHVVLCAFVSPSAADRKRVRERFPEGRFVEVLVTAPPDVLRARDPKGLYARSEARTGDRPRITDSVLPADHTNLVVHTANTCVEDDLARLVTHLRPWLRP